MPSMQNIVVAATFLDFLNQYIFLVIQAKGQTLAMYFFFYLTLALGVMDYFVFFSIGRDRLLLGC